MSMFKPFLNKKHAESSLQVPNSYIILDKSYSRKRNEMELSMILSCNHINKAFGTDEILSEVSFHIEDQEKAAIVGINGAGKSTLLKIIVGELAADSGEVVLAKGKTLGYLAQHQDLDSSRTIYEELKEVKQPIIDMEQQIRELEVNMQNASGEELEQMLSAYSRLSHTFELENGYAWKSELTGVLKGLGFTEEEFDKTVSTLSGGQKTRVSLGKLLLSRPDIILLDMNFSRDAISGQEGFESLQQILKIDPQAIVIFMTAYADTDKAVRAIKAGATDFIPKPWEKEKLLATLSSGMKLRQSRHEVNMLKEQVEVLSGQGGSENEIIGESAAMQEVFATINKLSETDANILILGENGTGKDVIARLLYRCSPRYGKPFVTIDLGSIPEQLFESELFGYEKGAFTDARKAKAGRMEVATGGTLFLDEIGNLSLPMQSKLLTAIEKRQISRLGSTQSVPIDVRLVCATNADIRAMVDEGNFRQDLLYRINTIEIHIPPLRERGNDVILLAEFFLERYARKYKKDMHGLTREAKNKLLKYNWPGNVRELQHTIERAVILGDGSLLKPENFLFHSSVRQKKEEEVLNLEQLERQAVDKAMRLSEGNITRAAEYLGITRFALYRKLEKLGL